MPKSPIRVVTVEKALHVIRGHRVMLERDLARLYVVPTKSLNLTEKRNDRVFQGTFAFS